MEVGYHGASRTGQGIYCPAPVPGRDARSGDQCPAAGRRLLVARLGVAEYAGAEERLQLLADALCRARQAGRTRVDLAEMNATGSLF